MEKETIVLATRLAKVLKEKTIKIVTAESCTGGGIAQAITDIAGSSAWFDRGFVTYSNQAKVQMLQVKPLSLDKYGAVSQQVAIEMVEGALINSDAELAVSVTGIAGPTGGSQEKPVGTVFIAWKITGKNSMCTRHLFSGDRMWIREQTVQSALNGCLECFGMNKKHSLFQKSEIYLTQLLHEQLPDNSHFFLFGSRARGTAAEMADIDIGIIAESVLPSAIMNNINEMIEESFVPYHVDLVDFNAVSESFKQQALKKVIPWN